MCRVIERPSQIYYFPPCGFGFWYLLGRYETIKTDENVILVGASAGSLICVCSLLTKEDLIINVLKCAEETRKEYKTINLYLIITIFIDKLFNHIDRTNLETNLNKIRIQTTELTGWRSIVKHQIKPKTLSHLRELVLASCYIPILSNYNNLLYFNVDGKKMCDGIFVDFYVKNVFTTFDVTNYTNAIDLIIIPSNTKIIKMYNEGLSDGKMYELNKQFTMEKKITIVTLPFIVVLVFVLVLCFMKDSTIVLLI